jgi:uncharacterized lipoprotein YmbA
MRRRRSDLRQARGTAIGAGSLAAALVLAACSTATPVVHLHSLMPEGAAPAADPSPRPRAGAALVLVLDPVRLPAQVDQPQWLVQLPDGSLASLEQERWASPLRDEFRQAVLETLIVGHGAVELRHLGNATPAAKPIRVDIDVRRFDSLPGREARIEGSWTITAAASTNATAMAPAHCEWRIREASPGAVSGLAPAHRRAVARLANGIGAAMQALARGDAPTCPVADAAG